MSQAKTFYAFLYAEQFEPFHATLGPYPNLDDAMIALRDWLFADIWSRGEWEDSIAFPWGSGLDWPVARSWAMDLPIGQVVGQLAGHVDYIAAVDLRSVRSGLAIELPVAEPPSYPMEDDAHSGGGHYWPSFQNLVFTTA